MKNPIERARNHYGLASGNWGAECSPLKSWDTEESLMWTTQQQLPKTKLKVWLKSRKLIAFQYVYDRLRIHWWHWKQWTSYAWQYRHLWVNLLKVNRVFTLQGNVSQSILNVVKLPFSKKYPVMCKGIHKNCIFASTWLDDGC